MKQSLREVVSVLKNERTDEASLFGILIGVRTWVEKFAAELAHQERLSLCLLSMGKPGSLTESQKLAQRQIWLGADVDDIKTGLPQSIRNEAALGYADILLVVWDGVTIDDEVVPLLLSASLAMKPVIWIDVTGVVRVLQRELLTKAQRHILQSPSPPIQSLLSSFSSPIALQNPTLFLQAIADPVSSLDSNDPQHSATSKSRAGTVHKLMMALVQGHFKKAFSAVAASPISAYRGPAWDESEGIVASTPVLDEQFDRADIAASISAGKHRSSAWISSLASTTAVFAAVAGAINLWSSLHGAFWAILELGLVALVVSVLWRAKNMQWHSKWIGNRFVAEQLRYTRMGLPLLAVTKSLSEPSLCVLPDANGQPRLAVLSEDLRLVQQTIVRMGLPSASTGSVFIASDSYMLPKLRDYVLAVVHDQVAYHHRVHHEQHKVDHILHVLSLVLFTLTVAAIGGHFLLHADWLLIFTAFFPALAAGIHGLTTTLEISRLADQSKTTAEHLHELSEAIKNVLNADQSPWENWLQLRYLTLRSAEVMSDENSQWQKLVTHQKPKLPA
ncbi:hypothetical protein B9Z47_05440 [Limnohabitans sp. 2KL-1]|nr:hypothetical protein B9Z47_05440 [Limnohabitans sp. 2KL-1]